RQRAPRRRRRLRAQRPCGDRRGDDHDRRLRGVRPRPRPDPEVDRALAGLRRAGRRVPRAAHAGPRGDGPARAGGLVAAQAPRRRGPAPRVGRREGMKAGRWLTRAVVGIAQLRVVPAATFVNIALPPAQAALGFSDASRQWIVTAYALAFGSLLLLGGRLGDLFGRK